MLIQIQFIIEKQILFTINNLYALEKSVTGIILPELGAQSTRTARYTTHFQKKILFIESPSRKINKIT